MSIQIQAIILISAVAFIVALNVYQDFKRKSGYEECDGYIRLTIADLLREYADCPQEFEGFCAELFRNMGFNAGTTAKTNDGGYDMWMRKDGINYIAECKLYSSDNIIGRPLLQKLVGANATQRADKMVFITTSSFSKPAKEYATEQRIWLIDGNELQRLMDDHL